MPVPLEKRTWVHRWRRGGVEVGTQLFSISTEHEERSTLTMQLQKQKVRLLGRVLKLMVTYRHEEYRTQVQE